MYTVRDLEYVWAEYNGRYWEGRLSPPVFSILPNLGKNVAGQCGHVVDGRSEIRIASSMLESAGRLGDLVLHEMVHQYQREILHNCDDAEGGHGVTFMREALRITPLLDHRKRWRTALTPYTLTVWPQIIRPKSCPWHERIRY